MYEKYHVLFVDDEENILASIKRGLIDEEYISHFANSGEMAIEFMEQYEISVIVSDMKMPGMDGLELLKEVYQRWPKCVRIVLSGYMQLPQIILSINQADIFRFITKPWKYENDLTDSIRKALDYYILNEENEKYKQMLEKKNALYVKMLQTLENQTTHYMLSVNFLTRLGKSSIGIEDGLNELEKEAFSEILNSRKELLDLFRDAVIADKKNFQSTELTTIVSDFIENQFTITGVKHMDGSEIEIVTFYEMIKAAITAAKIILKNEFDHYGISARVGMNNNGEFCIYMLTMFDEGSLESKALFDKKLAYLADVIGNLSVFGLAYTAHIHESQVLIKIVLLS